MPLSELNTPAGTTSRKRDGAPGLMARTDRADAREDRPSLRSPHGRKAHAESKPGAFVNLFMLPRGEVAVQRTSKARPATGLTLYAALPMHRLADVKRLFARDPQDAPHGLRVIEAAPHLHAHGHIPRDKAQIIRSIYKTRIEETLAAPQGDQGEGA